MEKQKSAIMQMLSGERGNLEEFTLSDEYRKALDVLVKKIKSIQKKLADHPQLLEEFNELEDANLEQQSIYANDIYKEAFSFGLAIGQEVFSK